MCTEQWIKGDIKFCKSSPTNEYIRAEIKMLDKCIFLFSLIILPLYLLSCVLYMTFYIFVCLYQNLSTKVEDYCSFGFKISLKFGGFCF